jgi:hypothetical protein
LISDIAVLLSRKVLTVRFLKIVHFTASLEATSENASKTMALGGDCPPLETSSRLDLLISFLGVVASLREIQLPT